MVDMHAGDALLERTGSYNGAHEALIDEIDRRAGGGTPADNACRYSLLPAGKLFRPSLLLASAVAVGGDPRHVMPAAVSAEFGHVASLIHDDIIDGDEIRRGRPSVFKKYGVNTALVAGDLMIFYLFEALAECADCGVPAERVAAAVSCVARAGVDMCRGQSMETELTGGRIFAADSYLEMVRLKTSALFRAGCEAGAILGGADRQTVSRLTLYANHLGIAFQINDDLLAYTSEEQHTGKASTSDMRNGRMVLPVILAYQNGSSQDRRQITRCLSGRVSAADALRTVAMILGETGALAESARLARQHAESAIAAVAALPPGAGHNLLRDYAGKAVDRNR